jgi:hypothetical protein
LNGVIDACVTLWEAKYRDFVLFFRELLERTELAEKETTKRYRKGLSAPHINLQGRHSGLDFGRGQVTIGEKVRRLGTQLQALLQQGKGIIDIVIADFEVSLEQNFVCNETMSHHCLHQKSLKTYPTTASTLLRLA